MFIDLFLTFFRIGLFSFGGGMAMIPMYLTEVQRHDWMSYSEFMNIVAVSQMTPGPIAINMATYVGNSVAGWSGAIISTIAISLPSVLVILGLTTLLTRLQDNPWKDAFFFGIKSSAMALIFYAGYLLFSATILAGLNTQHWQTTAKGLVLATACWLIRSYLPKLQPVLLIIGAGIIGALTF